jgi:hypothetical protein
LTPSDYVMKAVKGGSAQTITNGSDQVITFIDDFDPQNWWTTNKFQPTIAGYYNLQLAVWWDAGVVTNNQSNIQFRKNGSTQVAIQQTQIVTGAGYGQEIDIITYFNGTTDYVEVTAFTGNTTSQNINGASSGTWFTAALITNGVGPAGATGSQGATASLAAGTASGTTLTFIEDRVYGTITTPETGSISADVTGGLLGVTNIVIHNSISSPTFSAVFKKLTGSGFYATSQINYIYSTYIDSTNIIYSINQVI